MTYTEITDAVTRLVKTGAISDTEIANVIDSAIQITWRELIETRKVDDFLQNRVNLTLTGIIAAKGVIKVDTYNTISTIKEIRFASGSDEWSLNEEDGRIPPAPIEGKPRAYRHIGYDVVTPANGDRIYLEPFAGITEVSDKCYVSYWKYPGLIGATPVAASGPHPPVFSDTAYMTVKWDTELVDKTAAYIFNYYKKTDQASFLLMKYKQPPLAQPITIQQPNTQ